MVYVGVDLHGKRSHVVALSPAGEVVLSRRIGNAPVELAQILRGGTVGLAHAMGVDAGHLQAAVSHALTHGGGGGHRCKLGRREVAQPVQRIVVAEASGQLAEPLAQAADLGWWCAPRGIRTPNARSVARCSASIWSAPDGSGLLRSEASLIQTDPDGSSPIVWMINRMIKPAGHPDEPSHALAAQARVACRPGGCEQPGGKAEQAATAPGRCGDSADQQGRRCRRARS
jgi:hypothetical protein